MAIQVVDGVIEDIRLGMEVWVLILTQALYGSFVKPIEPELSLTAHSFRHQLNHPKFNQRRVSEVKFLGEMYNYRLVESAVIFRTLYSFITFGVSLVGKTILPIVISLSILCKTPFKALRIQLEKNNNKNI